MKTLHNSTASQAKDNVPDLKIWGEGDMWKLICKASSEKEAWMKTTKALEIPNNGCLVQTETQQGDQLSQAVAWVPGISIFEERDDSGKVIARRLVSINYAEEKKLQQAVQESSEPSE